MKTEQRVTLDRGDSLDAALTKYREPDTTFVLPPNSEFETKGAWGMPGHRSLAPFCRIEGNGSRIILSREPARAPGGVVRPDRDLQVFTAGRGAQIVETEFHGRQDAFVDRTDPRKTWFVTAALRTDAGVTIEGVMVGHCRGSKTPVGTLSNEIEAFPIASVGPEGGSSWENVRVANCPARSYISAATLSHQGDNPLVSTIDDLTVEVGEGNWYGLGIGKNLIVRNLSVLGGFERGVYNDTDGTVNVNISNSSFRDVVYVLSLITPNGVPIAQWGACGKQQVMLTSSEIIFRAASSATDTNRWLAELWNVNPNSTSVVGGVAFCDLEIAQAGDATKEMLNSNMWISAAGANVRPSTYIGRRDRKQPRYMKTQNLLNVLTFGETPILILP